MNQQITIKTNLLVYVVHATNNKKASKNKIEAIIFIY